MKVRKPRKSMYVDRMHKLWTAGYMLTKDAGWIGDNILECPERTETEEVTAKQLAEIRDRFNRRLTTAKALQFDWAVKAGNAYNAVLRETFGVREDDSCHPIFHTLTKALEGLCADFVELFPDQPRISELIDSVRVLLGQTATFFEPLIQPGDPDPKELHDRLKPIVFGGLKVPGSNMDPIGRPSKLSLYEAYGEVVILAKDREEARGVLLRLKGWHVTGKHLHGISPQEIFGDGRSGRDVIEQYRDSAPCIIGASA